MNASNWFLYLLYFGTLISAIDPNAFKLLPVYIVCVCVCARLPCVPHSTEEHIPFMCTHNRQTGNGSVPYKRTYTMQTQTYTHALGPFIAVTHAIQLRVVPFGSRLIFLTPPSLALALAALNFHSLCEIHACRRDSIV